MNVGDKISHYTLEDKIGEGGFGDVYRARDDQTGLEVAIKCSRPGDGNRLKDFEQRFLREVSCISKLRHPGIVQLIEYGALPDGVLYLVMEYVCGLNLEVLIKRDAPYSYIFASNIILQVLDALSEAHAQGIVHRDLKPANIMLVHQGLRQDVVKLLDFGIAKAFDGSEPDLTRQNFARGAGFGTPQYMPPEQFYGRQIGPYSDLYAVGLLFYELLTGRQAMGGATLSEVVEKQLKKFPDIPPPFNQGPLFDIFRRALAKEAGMRYQSAGEMYCDIDAIVRRQSPFLPIYQGAAGNRSAALKLQVVKAPDLQEAPVDENSGEDAATVDTMAFTNRNERALALGNFSHEEDISNYNTMIFDSSDGSGIGPQSLYDEIAEMRDSAKTDDFGRIDPSLTVSRLDGRGGNFDDSATEASPVIMGERGDRGFAADDVLATHASASLNSDEISIATSNMKAHPELGGIQVAELPYRDSEYLATVNSSQHPEFANIRRGAIQPISTSPLFSEDASLDEQRTKMVAAMEDGSQSEDLAPIFHQQRTQFIPQRQLSMRRPTRYTEDSFLGRLVLYFETSNLGLAILNSRFAGYLRDMSRRVSKFIDSLYENHFILLVAIVCLTIVISVILLALMLVF